MTRRTRKSITLDESLYALSLLLEYSSADGVSPLTSAYSSAHALLVAGGFDSNRANYVMELLEKDGVISKIGGSSRRQINRKTIEIDGHRFCPCGQADVEVADSSRIAELEQRIALLTQQNSELRAQLEASQTAAQSASEEAAEASAQRSVTLTETRQVIADLQEAIDKAHQKVDSL